MTTIGNKKVFSVWTDSDAIAQFKRDAAQAGLKKTQYFKRLVHRQPVLARPVGLLVSLKAVAMRKAALNAAQDSARPAAPPPLMVEPEFPGLRPSVAKPDLRPAAAALGVKTIKVAKHIKRPMARQSRPSPTAAPRPRPPVLPSVKIPLPPVWTDEIPMVPPAAPRSRPPVLPPEEAPLPLVLQDEAPPTPPANPCVQAPVLQLGEIPPAPVAEGIDTESPPDFSEVAG